MALLSKHTVTQRLKDTSGASIVIALVFFLICAVVGSVVLTAASINAKAVATHRDTQQAEYTVSSAAQLMADQLTPVTVKWRYEEAAPDPFKPVEWITPTTPKEPYRTILVDFFDIVWPGHISGTGSEITSQGTTPPVIEIQDDGKIEDVYFHIKLDRDFNMTILLSQDSKVGTREYKAAPYDETVSVKCIPTYDAAGKLLMSSWKTAVITKTNGGTT